MSQLEFILLLPLRLIAHNPVDHVLVPECSVLETILYCLSHTYRCISTRHLEYLHFAVLSWWPLCAGSDSTHDTMGMLYQSVHILPTSPGMNHHCDVQESKATQARSF